jgi:hypothetical protein
MNPLKIGFLALIMAATLVPSFSTPADAKKNHHGWGNSWRHDNGRHLGWFKGRGRADRRFIQNPVVYPGYGNYWNNNWNNNNWNNNLRYNHRYWH